MTVNLRGYSGYQAMTAGIGPMPAATMREPRQDCDVPITVKQVRA